MSSFWKLRDIEHAVNDLLDASSARCSSYGRCKSRVKIAGTGTYIRQV